MSPTRQFQRLKTWHLSSNPWNSAITEYVLATTRALGARGHGVTLSALKGSPAEERARGYGLTCESMESFSPTALRRLRRLARELEPDVIFTYGGRETTLAAMLVASGLSRTKTLRFCGSAPREGGALDRIRWRLSHWPVSRVLCPSEHVATALRRVAPDDHFSVVTLGCDEKKFVRDAVRRDQRQGRPEVLVFGRFDPIKNHDGAMSMLRESLAKWPEGEARPLLRIVGNPANVSGGDLQQMAAKHALKVGEDVVIDVGQASDVAALLSGATVGLVPSSGSEIICRVAEEFLLCGAPVLVSGVGSLDEVLFAGAGESYRGEGLAQQAVRLTRLLRSGYREDDATRARRAEDAKKLFSIAAMGEALERELGEVFP